MNQSIPSQSPLLPIMQEIGRQVYPASSLYVLATPIGNAGDITLRALHVLAIADAVACEDTRNSSQLLTRYGLNKPLLAAHRHNEREVAARVISRLQAGERIALVSDAGTPAVSDPGARLVDEVRSAGYRIIPIPGPSAAIAALSASGLVDERFHFVGFLPAKAGQRDSELETLRPVTATLVFYEAPHRILETVAALERILGPARRIVLARELTKLFEEIQHCPLSEASAWLTADSKRQKGEFVLLVEGAAPAADAARDELERVLRILLADCSLSQAVALAAKITGQKKNAVYELALKIQEG